MAALQLVASLEREDTRKLERPLAATYKAHIVGHLHPLLGVLRIVAWANRVAAGHVGVLPLPAAGRVPLGSVLPYCAVGTHWGTLEGSTRQHTL